MRFMDTKYGDLSGKVYDGDIDVSGLYLTSLVGSPSVVNGDFDCSNNLIESLFYSPSIIKGDFNCDGNFISDLDYLPKVEYSITLYDNYFDISESEDHLNVFF